MSVFPGLRARAVQRKRALVAAAATAAGMAAVPAAAEAGSAVEVETMSLPTSSGYVVSESAASGGKAFKFLGNATATKTVTTSSTTATITLRARGDQHNGAPVASVTVDGREVLRPSVSSRSYTDYSKTVSIAGGTHTLKVSFVNDSGNRNLFADRITFTDGDPDLAPAPAPTPDSGSGKTLFDGGFDGGLTPPWGGIQHCTAKGSSVTRVTSPVSKGTHAMKSTVSGNTCDFGSQRAEILNAGSDYTEGQERYFGFSQYFPTSFPATQQGHCTSMQLHTKARGNGGKSSAFSVNCKDDSSTSTMIRVQSNPSGGEGRCQYKVPMVKGQWLHFVWRVKFSATSGNWDLWYRTSSNPSYAKVVSNCAANSLLGTSDRAYLKLGLYRGATNKDTVTAYHDNAKVGTSFASVAP